MSRAGLLGSAAPGPKAQIPPPYPAWGRRYFPQASLLRRARNNLRLNADGLRFILAWHRRWCYGVTSRPLSSRHGIISPLAQLTYLA
jgi:hypothetical protein